MIGFCQNLNDVIINKYYFYYNIFKMILKYEQSMKYLYRCI